MSDLGILALLAAAAEALPNGTTTERAAWCKAHEREFQRPTSCFIPSNERTKQEVAGPKPFAAVADNPVVRKATQDGER